MLYLGTSSYSFKEWVGPFYPPETPPSKYLAYYSSRFNSVEINYTYRHFPTEKLSAQWASVTPESFEFSLKIHQSITHVRRLKYIETPLKNFLDNLGPLGSRLGVILVQLPPNLPVDLGRLEAVLGEIPADKRFAFEFRHPSWSNPEVTGLLRKAGVALCIAQNEILKKLPLPTAPYAYVRIRKVPPYSKEELRLLRQQVRALSRQVEDLYLYIKHEEGALAPGVALELQPLSKYYRSRTPGKGSKGSVNSTIA